MKVMTVLGTRPEIIRLSRLIPLLDENCDHVLVHTGQNYAHSLSDIFFDQLKLRKPDIYMDVKSDSFSGQIGEIFTKSEKILKEHKLDRLLILGDTNSSLCAYVAKRMGIPVYHMEAGNRCYDDRVPEEVNRRVIDHSSDILMPYTHNSAENLRREGIGDNRIVVTGNPIWEVLEFYKDEINASKVLEQLGLGAKKYFLVTLHRAENVDVTDRFHRLLDGLKRVHDQYDLPVIISTHPRTKHKMEQYGVDENAMPGLHFPEPFGFFDFVHLEKNAACTLSDSGTVQEECCLFKVPNVTLRDVTERQETVQCGSNILTGADPDMIVQGVEKAMQSQCDWDIPPEYLETDVSRIVWETLQNKNVDPFQKIHEEMARFGIVCPVSQ